MSLLLLSTPERARAWQPIFDAAGETLILGEDAVSDPADITHIACWMPPADPGRYPNLRAVISTGAGVDQMPALPPGVALTRTIAPGIDDMVRDWVVMATLMLHRDMPRYLEQAAQGDWRAHPIRAAASARVGIMGMGRIGRAAAASLSALGFDVAGYSRSGDPLDGIAIHGQPDLPAFLARSDLLICLLPLTGETRGILGDELFDRLPETAALIHAGRGAQLDMNALGRALDGGRLRAAMLDVTDPEPLPQDHWAWRDPRVIITPHVAANTDATEGARHALAVIEASRTGASLPGFIDRTRGY